MSQFFGVKYQYFENKIDFMNYMKDFINKYIINKQLNDSDLEAINNVLIILDQNLIIASNNNNYKPF